MIVTAEMDDISCLTGHLPIHLFENCLDQFRPFTVIREPIARVLSLYRFLKAGDPADMQRLGLRTDFSLDEFLGSPHPELYGQVNNGMVRMLCGDARLGNPECAEFWDKEAGIGVLPRALANLEQIDFGVTEEMGLTLELAQARWSVPYKLRQYHENTTTRDDSADNVADIHRIISMNTLDLALYHWARSVFRKRARALPQPSPDQAWNPRSVFTPPMNKSVSVGDIPGRRGFHEFEEIEIAWLYAEQAADIHFVAQTDLVRLRLHVFCVVASYPVNEIVVSVNDQPVEFEFSFVTEKWGWLETDYFETRNGLNRLAIEAPLFVQAATLDPHTADKRRLGVALADVVLMP